MKVALLLTPRSEVSGAGLDLESSGSLGVDHKGLHKKGVMLMETALGQWQLPLPDDRHLP